MTGTWDMITSGPNAGSLVQPLAYTATDDDTTRVQLWVQLATPLGSYVYGVSEGLDHARMLDPYTSDTEREELVRVLLLRHPRVAEAVVDVKTELGADLPRLDVSAEYTTVDGTTASIEASIGG